jgi:hypothetical protein
MTIIHTMISLSLGIWILGEVKRKVGFDNGERA